MARGQGRLIHSDGDSYEGEWYNDMPHGFGKFERHDGKVKYSGYWRMDKKHGEGVEIYEDGSEYHGNFFEGKKCGLGTLIGRNGTYNGDFKDNLFHGKGTFTWVDGRTYTGQWCRNLMHG